MAEIQGEPKMEGMYEELREVMIKLKEAWEKEEKYLFRKSRVKWLEFGDNIRGFSIK